MRALVLIAALTGSGAALAQQVPHNLVLDTPPVPGQIVETPRERLRLGPSPYRWTAPTQLGLPSSGPKGLQRESQNEARYAPSSDR